MKENSLPPPPPPKMRGGEKGRSLSPSPSPEEEGEKKEGRKAEKALRKSAGNRGYLDPERTLRELWWRRGISWDLHGRIMGGLWEDLKRASQNEATDNQRFTKIMGGFKDFKRNMTGERVPGLKEGPELTSREQ